MTATDDATPRRCPWCGIDPLYQQYHDQEWGRPVWDSLALFERLQLEGQQAGLSWLTILRKRETMRAAFAGFDAETLARADGSDVERWLQNPGLIRHRGKLEALIGNARAYLALQADVSGGFAHWLWDFVDGEPQLNEFRSLAEVPAETPVSKQLSKALKKAGFRFVGPVICYAFMQSAGLVNDHLLDCDFRNVD